MAGADYDGLGGVMRLLAAGEKPDTFAIEVVTYHAAIEAELELIISALVVRPEHLFTSTNKLSFPHKAHILRAVWKGDPDQADIIHEVLYRLNEVRNAVAHTDSKQIKGCMAGLAQSYRKIDPEIGDEVSILEAAMGICLFMQDGSNVTDVRAIFEGLAHLVNVAIPKALGVVNEPHETKAEGEGDPADLSVKTAV